MMSDNEQNAQNILEDSDTEGESPAQIDLPPHVVENRELLEGLDPDRKLSIWNKCHTTEDVLVIEYLYLLDKTRFLPLPPTPEELETVSAVSPVLTCSKETQVKVINIFSAFLSNIYHKDNVTEACERDLPLFVPRGKFVVPNYSHLPLSYFEILKTLKENFACAVQLESIAAVQFTSELFLLRAFHQLKVNLKTLIIDHVKSEFFALFSIAGDNFKKEHKGKIIDWEKRKSTIHGSFPGWRKNSSAPPSIVHNRYAEKISKAILNNKIDLSGNNSHQQLRSFLERPAKPTHPPTSNAQQHPHLPPQTLHLSAPPPPPSDNHGNSQRQIRGGKRPPHRKAVTEYDRIFPPRQPQRKKNQRIMANRGFNNYQNHPGNADDSFSN